MCDIGKPDDEPRYARAPDAALEDMWSVEKIATSWDRLVTGQSIGWDRLGSPGWDRLRSPGWERIITGQTLDEELVTPLADYPSCTIPSVGTMSDESLLPSVCSSSRTNDAKEGGFPNSNDGRISSMYLSNPFRPATVSTILREAGPDHNTKLSPASVLPPPNLHCTSQSRTKLTATPSSNAGPDLLAMLSSMVPESSAGGALGDSHLEHHQQSVPHAEDVPLADGRVSHGCIATSPREPQVRQEVETPDCDAQWSNVQTVMVRNLPNKYTQQTFIEELDLAKFQGTFDFLYLPIDADTRANKGYAFVNFIDSSFAKMFRDAFDGQKLVRFKSRKDIVVKPAFLQGFEANYRHYSAARVNQGDPGARPLFLRTPSASMDVVGPPRRRRRGGGGSAIDQAVRRAGAPVPNEQTNEHVTAPAMPEQAATEPAPQQNHQKIFLASLLPQPQEELSPKEESPMWVDVSRRETAIPARPRMQRTFCPYCGTKVHVSAKFCSECGGDLRA